MKKRTLALDAFQAVFTDLFTIDNPKLEQLRVSIRRKYFMLGIMRPVVRENSVVFVTYRGACFRECQSLQDLIATGKRQKGNIEIELFEEGFDDFFVLKLNELPQIH